MSSTKHFWYFKLNYIGLASNVWSEIPLYSRSNITDCFFIRAGQDNDAVEQESKQKPNIGKEVNMVQE